MSRSCGAVSVARRRHRHHPESVDAGILPLVNVVFLLLIVVLLMGRLAPSAPFAVSPPESTQGAAIETIEAVIHIAADGRFALDGEPEARATLLATLAARPQTEVRIEADARVEARAVIAFLEDLRATGVRRVALLTEPRE